ncbi:MAG: hypothetical protein WDO73_25245 [Ignavibacteriota bacterium]
MNGYELAARETKVSKLVDALIDNGISSEVAKTLDSTDWGAVAKLAKCNPPSEITIAVLIRRLEQLEQAANRKAVIA